MGRLFGTDGVRGLANRDLTAELALALSVAAARVLGESGEPGHGQGGRPLAVVGRDPRASGEFLEAAVVAGLAGSGVDVVRVGVVPTPGVAYLTAALDADLGVMLSASHNPMPDNGIKFFSRGGHKLPDEVEDAVEDHMEDDGWRPPVGADVGRVTSDPDAVRRYVDHLVASVPGPLAGVRVVLDCANGAGSEIAPLALEMAGAQVQAIHRTPDGYNINHECGSTHMESLAAAVVASGADAGIALDGDADRCLAVDAAGRKVDGDQIMAVLALASSRRGDLVQDTVVATVMSNLGFRLAMESAGVHVVQTGVGDRYVLEAMREHGYSLGGEQSGHLVMSDHATTGDGTLTALHLLAEVAARGPLAELAAVVTKYPQVLINVRGVDKSALDTNAVVQAALTKAEAELGKDGRILLRTSGTEPLVRVMVEADSTERAQSIAGELAAVVERELALD
jgi:phosphoglucosamine mutase